MAGRGPLKKQTAQKGGRGGGGGWGFNSAIKDLIPASKGYLYSFLIVDLAKY